MDNSKKTYVHTENNLCPNDITQISGGKLLFSSKQSDGLLLSIFNTDKQCIEESLQVGEILAHSKDYRTLYVLDKCGSSISIIRTDDLSIETVFKKKGSEGNKFFHVDNEKGLLFVIDDSYIYSIDIESSNIQKFELNDNIIGITETGHLITYTCKIPQYEYIDLKSSEKGNFSYDPLITKFDIFGFAITNPVWLTHKNGEKYLEEYKAISDDFTKECREQISKGNDSESFSKEINFDHIDFSVCFYPAKEGVYVIECLERLYDDEMTYYKQLDCVSSPYFNLRERLVWISNKGYETSFCSGGDYGQCLEDIQIKNEKAIFKANSSLYLMLKNGEVVSTCTNKDEAIDFLSSDPQ